MRIVNSQIGDPVLVDTANGLCALSDFLNAFLAAPSHDSTFVAETAGNPAPYEEFLLGLKVTKGSGLQLTISDDRWLHLTASPQELQAFAALVRQPANSDHRHLYCTPASLIIEEGDPWSEA